MTSTPFDRFIEPARSRPQIWRIVAGIVLIALVWMLTAVAIILLGAVFGSDGSNFANVAEEILSGETVFGLSILLLTFFGLLLGCGMAARVIHKRSALSLFGAGKQPRRDFRRIFLTTSAIYGVIVGIWLLAFDPIRNTDIVTWLTLLPIGILGVALQTLAEEIAFRGYLLQQLAARFRSPVIWMGGSAALFGAMHFTSAHGLVVGLLIVAATTLIGLLTADLTRRTGSVAAAWSFHFANNLFALLIISVDGSLNGMALFTTPYSLTDSGLMPWILSFDVLSTIAVWIVLVRVLNADYRTL